MPLVTTVTRMNLLFSLATILSNISSPSYKLIDSTFADGKIPVQKYVTTKAGLEIVIARTEGPAVYGYIYVATKAHDDNGLAHALEHLTFLGSEDYPYKGALDLIGNRCYADGTNAFTASDHTGYTCASGGKEGFLVLLPIYLDHILYPTLTSHGFVTEVHHIDGKGMNGGVVYSEMEGFDTFPVRCFNRMLRALYPDSGYGSYTGGALKNLRENATIELAREFHKKYYRPDNLSINIIGDVSIDEIVHALAKFEDKILSKPKRPPFERPWQSPLPLFNRTVVTVPFPSPDEDSARVLVGWRGPNCVTDFRNMVACNILLTYLCSSVGPVTKKIVMEEKLASLAYSDIEKNAATALYMGFFNVPLGKANSLYNKLQDLLKDIVDGKEKIDLNFIRDSIAQKIVSFLHELESVPQDKLATLLATLFLYGKSSDDFKEVLNIQNTLKYLASVDETFWINILKKYLVKKKFAMSVGIASTDEMNRVAKEEKHRLEKQIKTLGPNGLNENKKIMKDAMEFNSIAVPASLVNSVPSPSARKFKYIPIDVYRTGDKRFPGGLNLNSWPMYAEGYNFKSNFVYITASLFTHDVNPVLKRYLQLFLNLLYASPVQNGDIVISPIEMSNNMSVHTMSQYHRFGIGPSNSIFNCGSYCETLTLMVQVEKTKYELGVKFIKDLLLNTLFNGENISSCVSTVLNSVTDSLSDGKSTTMELLKSMYYSVDSNVRLASAMYQRNFLGSLLPDLLFQSGTKTLTDDLNTLRNHLVSPSNLAIHVAADWAEMKRLHIDVNAPWQDFAKYFRRNVTNVSKKLNVVPDWKVMINSENVNYHGEVVGLGTTETAFMNHASPGINDFFDPNLPALYVLLKYLSQTEGPMWRRIRGPGYTYGYKLIASPNEGLIHYSLYRTSDIMAAFDESVNIINELIAPKAVWEQTLIDCAKHSAIFNMLNNQISIGDLPLFAMQSSFQQKTMSYTNYIIEKISEVTMNDVKRVAKLYLTKVFSTTKAKTVIVCSSTEANEIAKKMEKYGLKLVVRQSYDESFLSKF